MSLASAIQSEINRVTAQIDQLLNGGHFSKEEIDILLPRYQEQLKNLQNQLKQEN